MKKYGRVKLAGLNISIRSKKNFSSLGIDKADKFFSKRSPNFILGINYAGGPKAFGKKIFDSEGAWALYKKQQRYTLRIPGSSKKISRLLVLDANLTAGQLYIKKYPGFRSPLPLEHPLGQILLTLWLSKNGGATFHACGLKKEGNGILFLGPSGSGKSTMARLWNKENGVTVLSDERIIIRRHNLSFYIYGTPWAGRAKMSSPQKAPLKKIFFIKPARENSLSLLKPSIAVGKAIVLSYLPIWEKKGMQETANFLANVFQSIPSYKLRFKRNREMIDLVSNI